MCEAMGLVSAGMSLMGGARDAKNARSRGRFEAAQIEAAQTRAVTGARRQENELRRSFEEQASNNAAAAAVSGFASKTFESVRKGNQKDLNRNIAQIGRNADREISGLETQKMAAETQARLDASAAMFSGVNAAADSIYAAEKSYQKSGLKGEGRFDFFKRSLKS